MQIIAYSFAAALLLVLLNHPDLLHLSILNCEDILLDISGAWSGGAMVLGKLPVPGRPTNCTARQCSPLRRKFMDCSINNPALSLLMKHLVTCQRQKAPNFSAFHWSPHGSLVSIGQHFVTTRVVHLPKRTETRLITKFEQSGYNHQLLQLCTACKAWSESDQAMRAVHSCDSWF